MKERGPHGRKACTDIHINKIIKMISSGSQCLLWRSGVGGVSVSGAGLGQTRSWHSLRNSLILSNRYCWHSCDSPGGGMMGGKSFGDGVHFSSSGICTSLSGLSTLSLTITYPGLVCERKVMHRFDALQSSLSEGLIKKPCPVISGKDHLQLASVATHSVIYGR